VWESSLRIPIYAGFLRRCEDAGDYQEGKPAGYATSNLWRDGLHPRDEAGDKPILEGDPQPRNPRHDEHDNRTNHNNHRGVKH